MTDTVETKETEVKVETPVQPVQEAKPKFIIQLGQDGKEVSRKPLGKGRPATGSYLDTDGNRIVPFVQKKIKVKAEYITLDLNGKELSRTAKGKGKPKAGFEKQTDGQYKGHYVMVQKPVAEPAAPATPAPVVQPTETTPA